MRLGSLDDGVARDMIWNIQYNYFTPWEQVFGNNFNRTKLIYLAFYRKNEILKS